MDDATRKEVTRLLKRGLNHYGLGDLDAAIGCWEKAQALDPSNRAVHDYLETAYEESGLERKPEPLAEGASLAEGGNEGEPLLDAEALPEEPFSNDAPLEFEARSFDPVDEEPTPGTSRGHVAFDDDETPRTFDGPPGTGPMANASGPSGDGPADSLIVSALDDYKEGRLDEAWDTLQQVADQWPERLDIQGYLAMVRAERARFWAREIGDQGRVLQLRRSMQELLDMNLKPDEGFLLSQIDGSLSIEELLNLSTDRVRTLEIIAKFLRENLVE